MTSEDNLHFLSGLTPSRVFRLPAFRRKFALWIGVLAFGFCFGPGPALAERGAITSPLTSLPKPRPELITRAIIRPDTAPSVGTRQFTGPVFHLPDRWRSDLEKGISALDRRKFGAFREVVRGSRSELVRSMLTWQAARVNKGPLHAEEMQQFLAQHAGWPSRDLITKRMEEAYVREYSNAGNLIENAPPAPYLTEAFSLILAQAHFKRGEWARARELAIKSWLDPKLSAKGEAVLLGPLAPMLSDPDFRARFRVLMQSGNLKALKRLAPKLDRHAQMEIDLLGNPKAIAKIYQSKGAAALQEAMLLVLAKDLAKNNAPEAGRLLETLSGSGRQLNQTRAWRRVRLSAGRALIKAKSWRLAVSVLGARFGDEADEDALMLAGRIAIHHLADLRLARTVFARLRDETERNDGRAAGNYWLAKIERQSGYRTKETAFLHSAARYPTTLYGQLALEKLGQPVQFFTKGQAKLSRPEKSRLRNLWLADKRVQAGSSFHLIERKYLADLFFVRLGRDLTDGAAAKSLVDYLEEFGYGHGEYNVAKIAAVRGFVDDSWHYQLSHLPDPRKGAGGLIDRAYQYAVARRESRFDSYAQSGADALGLMQLLLPTARGVARKRRLKVSRQALLTDSRLNVTLGAAYLGELRDRFKGAMPLVLSSYNAGPGRTDRWLKNFGDPRKAGIDWVDWIESIPFRETRHYVKEVLADAQIYRWLLAGRKPIKINLSAEFKASR